MKIAAAQTIVTSDISANGIAIRQMIAQAAADGAQMVNFCEGALSGYGKAQIGTPEKWASFDWTRQEAELREIANLCGRLGVFAAVGAAHRLADGVPPHNSVYLFSDGGVLLTRYDKRFLSNSELGGWYTPGAEPVIVEIDGYRFGCAICIESQFSRVFSEYEDLNVDAVLFSSYGIPSHFQIALQAHAELNCVWIVGATPAQKAHKGAAGIIGPDGDWVARCSQAVEPGCAMTMLDRDDPAYDIQIKKARPWRKKAKQGDIYREKMVNHPRSLNRSDY